MIQAITFDFWDTIAIDESDEPKRKAAGLPTKKVARETAFVSEVLAHHPELGQARAIAGWDHAQARFKHWWKVEHHTPDVATRLRAGFEHLGIQTTPGFDGLVHTLERMEVEVSPDPIPGAVEAILGLSERWPLGIVSDAIVTPGTGLREILDSYGILHCFKHFVFSDEVGAAKPNPKVFYDAAAGLGADVTGIVHIGDREANDIVGPANANARSILFTAAIDRGSDNTNATAVAHSYPELVTVLERL